MKYIIFYAVVWMIKLKVSASNLPRFVQPCTTSELDCWKRNLEKLRPLLINGIPEFELPSVNPLRIPIYRTSKRHSNVATYDANLTNIVWTGVQNYEVLENTVDLKMSTALLKIKFPKLHYVSEEDVIGNILGFPVAGHLQLEIEFDNLTTDIILNGKDFFKDDGEAYVKWEKEEVTITYDDVRFTVRELFDDFLVMRVFNTVINSSIRIIDPITRGLVENMLVAFILESLNRVHRIFPKNTLYVEHENRKKVT